MITDYMARILLSPTIHVTGDVLNVGLGPGDTARALLKLREVDSVVSVEKEASVVAAYNAAYTGDPLEAFHTIITSAAEDLVPGAQQFDLIYADIIESFEQSTFDALQGFILKAVQVMKPTSKLVIEYQGDLPTEREFRVHWITQHLDQVVVQPEPRLTFLYYRLK